MLGHQHTDIYEAGCRHRYSRLTAYRLAGRQRLWICVINVIGTALLQEARSIINNRWEPGTVPQCTKLCYMRLWAYTHRAHCVCNNVIDTRAVSVITSLTHMCCVRNNVIDTCTVSVLTSHTRYVHTNVIDTCALSILTSLAQMLCQY